MIATSLMLLATFAADPTKTTPTEIIATCYFNDAKVDATLLHHVVDVTSKVASVGRDGIGGYIVKLEARLHTPNVEARGNVHCYFEKTAVDTLARIRPGREITIRGVVRQIDDDTLRYVDPNVLVTIKNCELVGGAE
jgi:hypothetical protein